MADPTRPTTDFGTFVNNYLNKGAPVAPSSGQGSTQAAPKANDFGSFLSQKFAPPAPPPAPAEEAGRPLINRVVDPLNIGFDSFERGITSGVHSSASAIGTLIGADEFARRQQELAADNAPEVGSFSQVSNPQKASQYLYGLLGQSLPEMATVTGAAIGGGIAGSPGGPVTAAVTGFAAMYSTSAMFHAGRNLQRQEQETGEKSYGRAFGGAVFQAGLDVAVPGKLGGAFLSRIEGAAETAFLKSGIAKDIAIDTATEGATEFGQQLIEIGQANPELLRVLVAPQNEAEMQKSDQLLGELVESFVGGSAAGGVMSGVMNASKMQGATKEQIEEKADIGAIDDKDLGTDEGGPEAVPDPDLATKLPVNALPETPTPPRRDPETAPNVSPVSEENPQGQTGQTVVEVLDKDRLPTLKRVDTKPYQEENTVGGVLDLLLKDQLISKEEHETIWHTAWGGVEAFDAIYEPKASGEEGLQIALKFANAVLQKNFLQKQKLQERASQTQQLPFVDSLMQQQDQELDTEFTDVEELITEWTAEPEPINAGTLTVEKLFLKDADLLPPGVPEEAVLPAEGFSKGLVHTNLAKYLGTKFEHFYYANTQDPKIYKKLEEASEIGPKKFLLAVQEAYLQSDYPDNSLFFKVKGIDLSPLMGNLLPEEIAQVKYAINNNKNTTEENKQILARHIAILQQTDDMGTYPEKVKDLVEELSKNKVEPKKTLSQKIAEAAAKKEVQPPQKADKDLEQLLSPEQVWKDFNDSVIYSYDKPGTTSSELVNSVLNSPLLKGVLMNENYQMWAKDNKFWWDPVAKKPYIGNFKPGLLPGMIFHGTPFLDMDSFAEGRKVQIKAFKKGKEVHGGGDTHYGVFFNDSPHLHWGGTEAGDLEYSKGYKIPLLTNIKKPYLVNSTGQSWSPNYTGPKLKKAFDNGFDAVIFFGLHDAGGPQNQIVIPWDKANGEMLKSPYNKGTFDPKVDHFSLNISGYETIGQGLTTEDYGRLKEALAAMGLKGINLKVFAPDSNGKGVKAFWGRDYDGLLIGIENALQGSWGNLHHEAIHALKSLGFFDSLEGKRLWKALATEVRIRGISPWVKQNYPKDVWVEEMIARMLGDYVEGQGWYKPDSQKTLWEKGLDWIMSSFRALVNWGMGYGFTTSEEIFEYLTSGSPAMRNWMEMTKGEPREAEAVVDRAIYAMNKVGAPVPKGLKKNVDYYNGLVKWGWNVVQLAQKNLHIPWLQEYVQQANRWYNEKMLWLSRANETISMWNNLRYSQQEALSRLIFEIEEMAYRTPLEVQNGVVRKPTKAELAALMQKHKINKAGVDVYLKMRQDFDAILDKLETIAMRDMIRIMPNNPIGQQLEGMKIQQEFAALRKRPYFPHARFGNYTIVVKAKDGKTIYMEAFEKERDRNAAMEGVRKAFPNDTVSASFIPEEAQIFRGLPPSILMAIKHTLKLTPIQEGALEEMLVHMSPTQSFKNHFVRKENTPGYSRDALRAYADYFWHAANHIARLEYGPLLEEAIKKSEADVKGMIASGEDSTTRVKMGDYLRHHLDNIMNPKPDWAQLRTVGFLWWLGFNVKSALLNFTQVPMVAMPFLSAQFGDLKTNAQLVKTMTHLRTIYRSPARAAAQMGPMDAKLISLGIEQGFLDESFAQQLAGIAEGGGLVRTRGGSRAHKMILGFNTAAGAMFQVMEKVNRRVAFMAAVELARSNPNVPYMNELVTKYSLEYKDLLAKGLSPQESLAFLAGKDTVRRTQFEYSAWARPRFMEGRKSAFFTFFMFSQNMLWFIQNSPGNTRYLLVLLAFAGIMGMPGAEDLEALVQWLARQMGYEFNLEKEIREVLVEVLGDSGVPPDLFIRGASRYGFGLEHLGDMTGLPLPAVDMSGNIGMGSPLPMISPAIQAINRQGDFDDKLSQFTQEGVGATFGIGVNILRAIADTDLALDDPKRWERAMPAAVANVSKAVRQWKDGAETMRGGAELIPFDQNNPEHMAELIAQGLGFRPTRTAQAWDRLIMQREAEMFWTTRRGMIMDQYFWARQDGEKEAIEAALDARNRFNASVPYRQMRVENEDLRNSVAQRGLAVARREANVPDAKMMRGIYREVGRLHPEVKPSEGTETLPSGN